MSLGHQVLVVDGEAVGDLVMTEFAVSLFSHRRELAALDGLVFASVEEARSRATLALRRPRLPVGIDAPVPAA